jgi:streptogramin lyase
MIHNHLAMLETSVSLAESLEEEACEEKDKKAIVDKIARITITTINSTKVKPFDKVCLVLFILNNIIK